mgnify:CR=1 FL=1|tara:strand:+ start:292 stop:459 length:168 start_codon:yes stop_codon:yes gene_type:complete
MSLQERLDTLSAELRATVDEYNAVQQKSQQLQQRIIEIRGGIMTIQDIMKEDDQA